MGYSGHLDPNLLLHGSFLMLLTMLRSERPVNGTHAIGSLLAWSILTYGADIASPGSINAFYWKVEEIMHFRSWNAVDRIISLCLPWTLPRYSASLGCMRRGSKKQPITFDNESKNEKILNLVQILMLVLIKLQADLDLSLSVTTHKAFQWLASMLPTVISWPHW